MTVLDTLAELERKATPGPWRPYRCDDRWDFTDANCHCVNFFFDNKEFIAAIRNHAADLIAIASYAKSLFSEEGVFEAVSHFNVAFGLREALQRLEGGRSDARGIG